MTAMPKPEADIISRIYEHYEKENTKRGTYLTRLGASSIGGECMRQIWYSWRAYSEDIPSGRMLRLFKTGYIQEDRVIEDLRNVGIQIWDKDPNGKQYEFTDGTGHFVTKPDGIAKGIPGSEKTAHILEIKSHNKKSFEEVFKKGVKVAKPAHYAQMHCEMGYSGVNRAIYVAICKDDENYYVERLVEDGDLSKSLQEKIASLIEATIIPTRLSEKQSAFDCRWCTHKKVCCGESAPKVTCRSCVNSQPIAGGMWMCNLLNQELTMQDQLSACSHYEVLE